MKQTDYYTRPERADYGHLRSIARHHGGYMRHVKKGHRYGAWKVTLNGKTTIFEGTGMHRLPALDKYYVGFSASKTWDEIDAVLVPGAEQRFLKRVG